jgi:hypothetical protein
MSSLHILLFVACLTTLFQDSDYIASNEGMAS